MDLRVSSEGEDGTHRDEMVHPRWSELTHGEPRITLVSPRINPCHLTHFQPLPMLLTKLNSSEVLVPLEVALPEDSQSPEEGPTARRIFNSKIQSSLQGGREIPTMPQRQNAQVPGTVHVVGVESCTRGFLGTVPGLTPVEGGAKLGQPEGDSSNWSQPSQREALWQSWPCRIASDGVNGVSICSHPPPPQSSSCLSCSQM